MNPASGLAWTRVDVANSILEVLLGSRERQAGEENKSEMDQEIKQRAIKDESKALFDMRNLIGELSKPEVALDGKTVDKSVSEIMKSEGSVVCDNFEVLKLEYDSIQAK